MWASGSKSRSAPSAGAVTRNDEFLHPTAGPTVVRRRERALPRAYVQLAAPIEHVRDLLESLAVPRIRSSLGPQLPLETRG
eukprot:6103268-Pyramimonas_sp.AAC.1